MTARPIRRNAQVPDRNGKFFYTSFTSLSHISKVGRDIIWDVENNKILSIEDGVSQLMEGMVDPITKYGLTEDEIKAVEELFKQINDTEEE